MIGNVWEWTTDWYSSQHTADPHQACCIPGDPRGGPEDELRSVPTADQDFPQGGERRLAPLRAELLPPLSPGRAPCAANRHFDEPCRVSMRCARQQGWAMTETATKPQILLAQLAENVAVLINAVALAIIVIGTIEIILPPEHSRYRPPLGDWSRAS